MKLTTEEFKRKAISIHGKKYSYDNSVYNGRIYKLTIGCPFHGEFLQTPKEHLRGRGCSQCAGNIRSTTSEFVRKSQVRHQNKYTYDDVIYTDAHQKVCIGCPSHGNFWQTPHEHLAGKGCHICGVENRHWNNGFRWDTYTFPNGRQEKVQGYESWTIDHLLTETSETQILVNRVEKPVISYEWSGSVHKYFPDCYLPDTNTIVETKSSYTWQFQKEQNAAKISGSLQSGYNIRFIIWDRNHTLVSDITYGNNILNRRISR